MSSAGLRAGKYVLRRRLGTGGMAEVWLAESSGPAGFQKQVVVKAILPHLAGDPEFVRLFLSEARLTARLNHPNVVQVFELFSENEQFFSVMEYVDGGSLRQLMRAAKKAEQALSPSVVARVIYDACQGLAYVHGLSDERGETMGVVHRDVSPDNILITRSGISKVSDFGVARASNSPSYTQPGSVRGKLSYIPAEVYQGQKAGPRGDLYALGVVAYEALTGLQPFKAPSEAETIGKVLNGDVPEVRSLRPDLDPALSAVISKAMHHQAASRFEDAGALLRALEPFAASSAAASVSALIAQLLPPGPSPVEPVAVQTDDLIAVPSAALNASTEPASAPIAPATAPKPRRTFAIATVVTLGVLAGALAWGLANRGTPAPPVLELVKPEATPDASVEVAKADAVPPEPSVPPPANHPPVKARARTGRLQIRAYPWADVMIDSTPAGMTPLPLLTLEAGAHQITLVNSSLAVTRHVTVQVRPGRLFQLDVDLSKPAP